MFLELAANEFYAITFQFTAYKNSGADNKPYFSLFIKMF